MLVIRQQQIDVFRIQPRLRFESDMSVYLKRYFPFEAANADLERWVQTGLDKAALNGFLTHQESALYLALMSILGAGFEDDVQIPWAKDISGPNGQSLDRITHVYDRAVQYLDAIGGPKCSWLARAKLRVRKQDMTVLDQGVHPRALAGRIRELLVRLYPQKAAVVGEKALQQLVKSAIARAQARGATSARPALISAVHMFFLGSAYEQDPCYPWTGATLAHEEGGAIEKRFDRMHRLLLAYLDRSFQFKA
jgi:hypothetical protein